MTQTRQDIDATAELSAVPAKQGGMRGFLKTLGPGLITGAADDDPSGIGIALNFTPISPIAAAMAVCVAAMFAGML